MAIAFDAGSSGYTDYAGSLTVSHTVSAGSDRFLVVGILDPSTSDKVSGITYNGVSLTRVRIETLGRGYLYVLTNPDSGTHNIVVTFTTVDQAAVVCAASFTGVDQTTPYSANTGSSNLYGTSPYSNSITCGTGEVAVDFFGCQDTAVATAGGSQTQIIQSNTSRTGAMSYLLNATAMSWTWASGQRILAHSVLALSPAAGSGPQTLTPSLFTNTSTFYAPTVAPGEVALTPSLFTNSNAFYSATVSLAGGAQTLTPGLFSNANAFYAATVARVPGFLTPVLKNNAGTVLASETGVACNVYNASTGALVVRKTGLTSSAAGIVSITDAAMAAGTTYAYEIVLSAARRLPVAAA